MSAYLTSIPFFLANSISFLLSSFPLTFFFNFLKEIKLAPPAAPISKTFLYFILDSSIKSTNPNGSYLSNLNFFYIC